MTDVIPSQLHLPSKDRSFWNGIDSNLPLLYLAWGRRNFQSEGVPVSRHKGWVVSLILEGNATLLLKDQRISLSKGHLVLIGPDCASGWTADKGSECRFLLCMWDDLPGLSLSESHFNSHWLTTISSKSRESYVQLLDSCRREVQVVDGQSKVFLTGCRMMFQSLIERSSQQASDKEFENARYKIAVQWLSEHLDSKQPIARLCDYLNMTQPSLYRLFRSQTNQSPLACFKSLKMGRAKELIQGTDLSVKEIAFTLGYDHFNDFSRAVKRHFQISAREMRAGRK